MVNYDNPTFVQLAVEGLLGDFNLDDTVDAADYVAWRKNDGTPEGFDLWRAHFGERAGGGAGAGANASVPEPDTVLLLLLGVVAPYLARAVRLADVAVI
jgi:hypothetical protein